MTKPLKPKRVTSGEFAGWQSWQADEYEAKTVGPFYHRVDDAGSITAMRVETRHLNGGGVMHGGALMSFADGALFNISEEVMDGIYGVTVTMNSEFLSAAKLGQMLEARGDVLRAGRSLIFVRGLITADGVPCLNFSGTIKKIRAKAPS
ncbi:PaaI family thioesterase [Litorimonas sp. RW-G-Af-16]|uniref:PaaI family thioesterase n=1 Tax=Litorimonas sp. RW-G-Af-16 TaxID=3241168 RepID=UPI00390CC4C2